MMATTAGTITPSRDTPAARATPRDAMKIISERKTPAKHTSPPMPRRAVVRPGEVHPPIPQSTAKAPIAVM